VQVPRRWRAITLAVIGAALLLAPAGASAQEAGPYDMFNRCPLDDPRMQAPDNDTVTCVNATTNGGSLQIGRTPIASTDGFPVNVQFGLREPADGEVETISQPGAVQATPVPVPGGLVGVVGEANLKRLFGPAIVDAVNRVTATVEQAGEIANFDINGALTGTPVFDLPVKLHLRHPLLGANCYIGSNADPIVFHPQSGTTAPPPPNEPITGVAGTLGSVILPPGNRVPGATNTFIIKQEDATLVDNSFAVPKARGCGPLGLLDGAINQRQTLPQAAGANTVILEDNDSHLGLAGPSATLGLSPAQVMELLVAPGLFEPTP